MGLIDGSVIGDPGGELLDEELLEEVADGSLNRAEDGVAEDEADAVAVFGGVVGVGDGRSGEVAEDVRVVGLPLAVVALADRDELGGVPDAGFDRAGAFVEVAGVLVEDRWEEGSGEEGADGVVAVSRAVAASVSGGSVAVAGVGVVGLLEAGDGSGHDEGDGVDGGLPGHLELLLRGHGRGVLDVGDVEVGEDGEDALLFLDLDLSGGYIFSRGGDFDGGERGWDGEGDGGDFFGFACADRPVGDVDGEAGCVDGEGEAAGGDTGELVAAVGAGEGGLRGAGGATFKELVT